MPTRREVLGSAAAVGTGGCMGLRSNPSSTSMWPQVHYDAANTGYAPSGALPDEPEATSFPLDDHPVTSAVASGRQIVFGLPSRHVARRTAEDGTGWVARPLKDRSPTGTPALGDDHAYVAEGSYSASSDDTALLRAIDLESGAEAWQVAFDDRFVLAPTLHEGTLYVRSETGVHAVDAGDGSRHWSVDREPFAVEGFDVAKDVSPAVTQGSVYVPNPSGVSAHDRANGEERWQVPAEKVRASPVEADGTVLVSGVSSGVTAVDAETGSKRWTWQDGGMWTSPAVAEDTVYATGFDLSALDLKSGRERWRYDVRGDVFASPIVVGETVVVASLTSTSGLVREGGILENRGGERWSTGRGSVFTPAVDTRDLVLPTLDGTLTLLR